MKEITSVLEDSAILRTVSSKLRVIIVEKEKK